MSRSAVNLGTLLSDLQRRRVFRVAAVYAAAAFVVAQIADIAVPGLHLPEWSLTLVLILLILGFPIALVLAWAYDITPEGVVRTDAPAGAAHAEPAAPLPGRAPAPVDRRSIAALPFANLSGDPDNEYFSDGITEEILARLAKIRELRVISRTSVLRYKQTTQSLRAIAAELGVANILEGTVRRAGNRVRITAQLIEAATDTHLWAESYDRELADIFEVQSEVAQSIAGALQAQITAPEQRRLEKVPTRDMAAYDLYLRGRQHAERATGAELRRALAYFEQAIQRDDQFALAYVGLAEGYLQLAYQLSVRPAEVFEPARAAANRALALDPELAEAHAVDGAIRLHYEWDWAGAEAALARALALSHSSPSVPLWDSIALVLRERFEEAVARADEACALNPFSPLPPFLKANSLSYFKPAEALPVARALVERDPGFGWGQHVLGAVLRDLGKAKEAIPHFRRAAELMEGHEIPLAGLAAAHAAAGQRREARRVADEIRARAGQRWVDPYALAIAALVVGDIEQGIDELERGEQERSFYTLWLRPSTHMQPFRELRKHPRVRSLLHRIWPEDFPA